MKQPKENTPYPITIAFKGLKTKVDEIICINKCEKPNYLSLMELYYNENRVLFSIIVYKLLVLIIEYLENRCP